MAAGIDNLMRLGMNTEAPTSLDLDELRPFRELIISGHAPLDRVGYSSKDGQRLNLGATDDDFRQMSIKEMLDYVESAQQFPRFKQINMHPTPKQRLDDAQTSGRYGDYDRMIDGIRQVADFAARLGLEIVLENDNVYWTGVADDVPPEEVDWTKQNVTFGAAPDEWIKICEDVDRSNVGLCLDSSHTATYAHTLPEGERRDAIMAFVSRPDLIRHVHWNDNYLYDVRGRKDSHASLGKGTLPIELHRAIKGLDATLLLEHFYTIEELEEDLAFIDGL